MPFIKFIWCSIKFLYSKKHPLCFVYCWKFFLIQPFPFLGPFDAVRIRTSLISESSKMDLLKWKNQTCSFAATHWYLDCCLSRQLLHVPFGGTRSAMVRWQLSCSYCFYAIITVFILPYLCTVSSAVTNYHILWSNWRTIINCICCAEFKHAQREWWQSMIIMIAYNIWLSNRSVHNKYHGLSCFV